MERYAILCRNPHLANILTGGKSGTKIAYFRSFNSCIKAIRELRETDKRLGIIDETYYVVTENEVINYFSNYMNLDVAYVDSYFDELIETMAS